MGNTQEAVDACHRALGLRRDDTFTTTLLGYVMEQLIEESPPFLGAPTEIPNLHFPDTQKETVVGGVKNSPALEESHVEDQQIEKLRVNLFSGWVDTSKPEDISICSVENNSEVEMLDSSNMKQD